MSFVAEIDAAMRTNGVGWCSLEKAVVTLFGRAIGRVSLASSSCTPLGTGCVMRA